MQICENLNDVVRKHCNIKSALSFILSVVANYINVAIPLAKLNKCSICLPGRTYGCSLACSSCDVICLVCALECNSNDSFMLGSNSCNSWLGPQCRYLSSLLSYMMLCRHRLSRIPAGMSKGSFFMPVHISAILPIVIHD